MNKRREIWTKAHGKIPKGWLVHNLNRIPDDIRIENLAAIPRYPIHLGQVTAPYVERIRNLEKELRLLQENKQNGNCTK